MARDDEGRVTGMSDDTDWDGRQRFRRGQRALKAPPECLILNALADHPVKAIGRVIIKAGFVPYPDPLDERILSARSEGHRVPAETGKFVESLRRSAEGEREEEKKEDPEPGGGMLTPDSGNCPLRHARLTSAAARGISASWPRWLFPFPGAGVLRRRGLFWLRRDSSRCRRPFCRSSADLPASGRGLRFWNR